MAGIQLIAEIEPKNSGSFALLDDKYMRGGLRVVETYDELASIPSDRLKDGCLSMITTPSRVLYVYDQETDTWSPFSSGGGGGGSDWLCVEDGETTKLVKDVDTWTQKVVVINHIRTYADYFALPTEYIQNNEVAYCKADVMEGTTTYKKGLYSYDIEKATWVEVNSTIEIDSALSDTSKRPVQNRVVTRALEEKVSKDDVDNVISRFSENPIQNKAVATALENIKNSRTMTTEEYEALDDETKNDGSFYYISDTGEIYQNGIIYGGKQIFDVTQEEYDALTDEEKSNNEYHCTDTGRTYINGILYGDKKPIELTYEEYKQLEADGLVEPDVDYIIVGNESGVLLSDLDTNHGDSNVSTYEVIETLKSDVENLIDDETVSEDTVYSSTKVESALSKKLYGYANSPSGLLGFEAKGTYTIEEFMKALYAVSSSGSVSLWFSNSTAINVKHNDITVNLNSGSLIWNGTDINRAWQAMSVTYIPANTNKIYKFRYATDGDIKPLSQGIDVLADAKYGMPLVFDSGIRGNVTIEIYKLSNVTYEATGGEHPYNLNLLLSTRAGEEVELFGGKNDAGWKLFARKNNDYSSKIMDIYLDGYDVYVRLATYYNFFKVYHKNGALRSDFAVTKVTSIPDTATEIPITAPGVMDNLTSTESTWSSSKINQTKADKQNNVKNTDYLKSDRPYLKISRNGSLSHVSYYTCETYILCSHSGDMGALSFVRNDAGASCVYKNIVGTLPLSVEKYDEYSCWLKYSSSASEIYTVYALNGYTPTVTAVTSTT